MSETITGFKGFDKDLKCKNYQYEVGKEFEEKGKIEACSNGFHFCENPFDVLGYYPPFTEKGESRYCIVEGSGNIDRDGGDTKVACSKLHISAEIGLRGIIEAGVKFILDKVNWKDNKESNTGDRSAATNTGGQSAATNTGGRSAATNTGDRSAATNTGDQSAATNTGDQSAATNTGYQSAATNTGDQSAATNTGDQSAATNTGDRSAATNTGDQSAATNTGYQSAAEVTGKESIAIVTGKNSKAKGAIGCWIVLTERGEWDGSVYPIKEVKAVRVDGEIIKPDTYYKLINGEVIPCE